jgi:hypothetical protein
MAFLSPLFLLGALAAAVPILLHLLKRQPEARVQFAAVKLLTSAPVEHTRKRFLRELLLLALRVSALVLLAFAFARPFFAWSDVVSSGVTVVALDTSLSMSAPGTFERARGLAKQAVARASRSDLVGVILFADTAQVVAPASGDRVLATSALDAAKPRFGATRYDAALQAAGQMLSARGNGHGTIVLVTDLQQSGWDATARPSLPEAAHLELADAGAPPQNLAVTAMTAFPDRTTALVRNFGTATREVRARLAVDGRPAGEARATLAGNQTAEVLLPPVTGRTAQVTIDDPDGLAADNARYLVMSADGSAADTPTLIVTANGDLARDAFYVREALSVPGRDGRGYRPAAVSGAQLSSWTAAKLANPAAILVLSTRGLDSRARGLIRAFVRGGGGVFITADMDVDGAVVSDMLGTRGVTVADAPTADPRVRRAFTPVDARHPLMRAFGPALPAMGLANFTRIGAVRGDGCTMLARFTTGEAALVECDVEKGVALLFASDLDNRGNDWPLRATFVPFIHEVVHHLAGTRRHAAEYLVSEVPAGIPAEPGLIPVPGGAGEAIAVNVDPRESDPARLSAADLTQAVTRWQSAPSAGGAAGARQQEEQQHLWQYAMIAVAICLAAESLVAARAA